jgi:hypothetical protein
MSNSVPVLLISYSRPKGLENLLLKCQKNTVSRIYIAIDGPRNSRDIENQMEIRKIIDSFILYSPGTHVQTWFRESNLGVGVSVISALDWFFQNEAVGHVLEDDLEPTDSFFSFSCEALERFESDSKIWMISGSQILSDSDFVGHSRESRYPMIWGWSTWRDSWFQMRESLLSEKKFRYFGRGVCENNYWAVGGKRVLDGQVDTWDTALAGEFHINGKICLIPPINLVSNLGNDEVAAHTSMDGSTVFVKGCEFISKLAFKAALDSKRDIPYDIQLRDKVFQVKLKHYFLPIVYIFQRIFSQENESDRLALRLSRVRVP